MTSHSTDADSVGARRLVRGDRTPLWQQLLADLRARVEAGEFTESFPGELELVADYQVSRHTVREALRQLRADGVVTAERGRRPRLGERVEIAQPAGALYSLYVAVREAGLEQESQVRVLEGRTDPVIASRLGLRKNAKMLFLERLRWAGDAPLALDQAWLPWGIGTSLLEADFSHAALYHLLAERAGVRLSGGREQIHAVVPTAAQRAVLDAPSGVAAFAIDRLGRRGDTPVEWRHTLVRADRFALTAESSARDGYRLWVAGRTTARPRDGA